MSAPAEVVTREEWLRRRLELLALEKELTRRHDELARRRRELGRVPVTEPYTFDTEDGPASLKDLFGGKSQLLVYHFMMGPDADEGCPSCSFWADCYDGIRGHLAQRDVALVAVSRGALPRLLAYRERMGWGFPWASSAGTSFNVDFGVSGPLEEGEGKGGGGGKGLQYNYKPVESLKEMPGLSAFVLGEDGKVYHTYSCYGRGLDVFNNAYMLLDVTAKGRDEAGLPWPMAWVRRHDKY